MGHANLRNISDFFIKRLYAKGKLSIREAIDAMVEKGETLHASEGEYEEPEMLGMGLEEVVNFLRSYDIRREVAPEVRKRVEVPDGGIIEPVSLTKEQEKILWQWDNHQSGKWDTGDDGKSGEYGILDSIQWKFAKGWRKVYPDIPRLGNVTH